MKTITFYSYKGGVGRSLALSNVANRLAEFGKKVCILDFDLEAPGLHLKFGEKIKSPGVQRGIVDYIYEFTNAGVVPNQIQDFVTPIAFGDRRTDMVLIAAGDTGSREYWEKLSCVNWKSLFYEENSQGVAFFYNLKEQIKAQISPDVLLVDSRTGITDISGVTMAIFADEVVLLAANNRENIEGISQVIKTLAIPSNSLENKVPKINFVLSRIPYFSQAKDKSKESNAKSTAQRIINDELKSAGITDYKIDKVLVIHSDQELELKEEFKIGYGSAYRKDSSESPIGLDYLELFEEITADMITADQKNEFYNYIKIESIIEKALTLQDMSARIKMLSEALEINPRSSLVLKELGISYVNIGSFNEALDYFDRAKEINPGIEQSFIVYKASSYYFLGKLDEALVIYMQILELIPDDAFVLGSIATIYFRKREWELALTYQEKAVKISPESADAWNAYGNILRWLGRHDEAMDAIYKALELDPQNSFATCSLAELYIELGNEREFYKNLELSFSFGLTGEQFQNILLDEDVYSRFYEQDKFHAILEKYEIDIDWTKIFEARK